MDKGETGVGQKVKKDGNQTQVERGKSIAVVCKAPITKIKQEVDMRKTRELIDKTEPDKEILATQGKYEQKGNAKD